MTINAIASCARDHWIVEAELDGQLVTTRAANLDEVCSAARDALDLEAAADASVNVVLGSCQCHGSSSAAGGTPLVP